MTPARARELVAEIATSVDGIRDRLVELYDGRGWVALGYGSWSELCEAEFGTAVGALLPREQRRELARTTTISATALGSALGVDPRTIQRDREQGRHSAEPVVGLDGKTYHPPRRPRPEPTPEEIARDQRTASGRAFLADLRRVTDPDGPLAGITAYADDSDLCRDLVDYLDETTLYSGLDHRDHVRTRLEDLRADVDRAVVGLLSELNRSRIRGIS